MSLTLNRALAPAVVALAMTLSAPLAMAQEEFPSKPIEVVIHSKYGGGTDATARMMMIRSRRNLDTDMFVTSQRGGSGSKAHKYAMGKDRDGHTVLALTQSPAGICAGPKNRLQH